MGVGKMSWGFLRELKVYVSKMHSLHYETVKE